MRYYRLWIYACNIVLLVSALGFAVAVGRSLLFSTDLRRYLVPGVPRGFEPITLYAYLVFTLQLGFVQLLGCIAARQLNTKLLNAYWLFLLALFCGDIVIGVTWVLRFEKIRTELRSTLRLRLQVEYAKGLSFKEQWDELQRGNLCCGVTGPLDFGSNLPRSCCSTTSTSTSSRIISITAASPTKDEIIVHSTHPNGTEARNDDESKSSTNNTDAILPEVCANPRNRGCEETLLSWLKRTADLLFVLGFCVIAFTKFCFLGILHYEIREMIRKIQLMKEPTSPNAPFIQSFCPPQQQPQHLVDLNPSNGDFVGKSSMVKTQQTPGTNLLLSKGGMYSETAGETIISGKQSLLLARRHDAGADSDTNSHCALILDESTPPAQHRATSSVQRQQQWLDKESTSLNLLELHEFNRNGPHYMIDGSSRLQIKRPCL